MLRFSGSGRRRSGAPNAPSDATTQRRRWLLRGAALLAVAVAVTLFFGTGGFNSEALRIKGPPPLARHIAVPTHTPVVVGSVTLPQAASNAAIELVGSGDSSPIGWFPYWGLWGKRDQPPGSPIGWKSPYWWQSALDLRALVRYLEVTHNTQPIYQQVIDQTFALNVRRPGSLQPINFGNFFMDDTAWWGLAWLEAARYEWSVRHDVADATRFMKVAEWDANSVWNSPRSCHTTGLAWRIGYPPDTITNDEFIALAAELAQVEKQPGPWYDPAAAVRWLTKGWQQLWWLEQTWLINPRTGHVYDSFNASCKVIGGALTYTEGETADALVQMGLATGWREYMVQARRFLSYALSPVTGMTYNGVIQEPCEATARRCRGGPRLSDSTVWKGIFVDAVADYRAATGSQAFDTFLTKQARAIIANSASNGRQVTGCQTAHKCQLGYYWSRQVPPNYATLPVGPGSQESGLSALTDALAVTNG